jgi:hypothetical protein
MVKLPRVPALQVMAKSKSKQETILFLVRLLIFNKPLLLVCSPMERKLLIFHKLLTKFIEHSPKILPIPHQDADIAFDSRDSSDGGLTYSVAVLNPRFTAANSVLNGINPIPSQLTGGEGAVVGTEVQFTVTYNNAFALPADSYFFIPQVAVNNGDFLWLSAPKPIVAPGTPFNPDLQSWIRNDPTLAPDWLRIGTDIVGGTPATTFNAAFSLSGETITAVPEPSTMMGTLICGATIVLLKHKFK